MPGGGAGSTRVVMSVRRPPGAFVISEARVRICWDVRPAASAAAQAARADPDRFRGKRVLFCDRTPIVMKTGRGRHGFRYEFDWHGTVLRVDELPRAFRRRFFGYPRVAGPWCEHFILTVDGQRFGGGGPRDLEAGAADASPRAAVAEAKDDHDLSDAPAAKDHFGGEDDDPELNRRPRLEAVGEGVVLSADAAADAVAVASPDLQSSGPGAAAKREPPRRRETSEAKRAAAAPKVTETRDSEVYTCLSPLIGGVPGELRLPPPPPPGWGSYSA